MNNNNTFDPSNENIRRLFSGSEGIFVIPRYQRQYSWGNEELDDLWNDFLDAYHSPKQSDYFLGSVVVVSGKGRLSVVDGQQRITTLMIMLNVLHKTFPNINSRKDEEDTEYVNTALLKNLIYYNGEDKSMLQLQTRPEYDSAFHREIVDCKDFSKIKNVSNTLLKKEDPTYKFRNTAKFFYDNFKNFVDEYGEDELAKFVKYIIFNIYIIKITCYDEPFAIKLFLILNDRGKDLASADIVKTYILDKYGDDEDGKNIFEQNWRHIEETCSGNNVKMDEFLSYYSYFKLSSLPRKQITDDFHELIKDSDIVQLVQELSNYENGMKEIFAATDKEKEEMSLVYSLRYVPWSVHVMAAMTTAYTVNYPDVVELFTILRRFYYLCWIAGKTLNAIKQTSFNIIKMIKEKAPLPQIEQEAENFIKDKMVIRDAYEALDGEVYGESFLKPLLFSLEYEIRDKLNTTFYPNNNSIHIDHILPKQFYKRPEAWPGIDYKSIRNHLNLIGNMALCSAVKNLEALNYSMDRKIDIYRGKDKYKSGYIPFDTTSNIVEDYLAEVNNKMPIENPTEHAKDKIDSRGQYLMHGIEKMFDLSRPAQK
ncbi:DUF262 domain-containing protein [Candidatus Saccharibacteria bacterium]|nr:DUF262 domain-containing protein [Candidatus Saccharibacteria bacterium]